MSRPGPKAYLLVSLFAFLLVILPFLFWYETWFGRNLSDSQLDAYFADTAHPRHGQHALVQVGERLSRGENVERWYPAILREAASPSVELRQTAAWIMGQQRAYAPFHGALLRLLQDPQPMVRRNAALALAAFGDAAARPELVAMLRPFTVAAPLSGVLKYRLKPGQYVNPGTLIAHIGETEVRATVPGAVLDLEGRDGADIAAGSPVASLSADKSHVWEALRALYLVGRPEDLEDVKRYMRPIAGMPESIQEQASLTSQAIQARSTAP